MIKNQYKMTRKNLFQLLGDSDLDIYSVIPPGFRNNIHWHIGHILVVAEQFLFAGERRVPERYNELFGNGTSPLDWQDEVPTVRHLISELENQLIRIKEISADRFSEKLPAPFLGQNTYGELAAFGASHEALHVGKIQAMKRVIEAERGY